MGRKRINERKRRNLKKVRDFKIYSLILSSKYDTYLTCIVIFLDLLGGAFYGDFPALPKVHNELKSGNQSHTFKKNNYLDVSRYAS